MAFAAKVANRLPLNEVKVGLKYLGQKLKSEVISELEAKLIGHEWDYYIKFDQAGNYIKQIWLRTGYKLFKETSEYLDDKLITVGIRPVQRTLDGIGFNVIPDQIEYVQRMLDYSVKAFRQGFDPLQNGVNQVHRLYVKNGVNIKVGGEFVENSVDLRKGIQYGPHRGFGWEHIVAEGHHNQIMENFRLANNNEAVKDFIQQGLREGIKDLEGNIIWNVPGFNKQLKIVMGQDPDKIGTIITTFCSAGC